MTENPFIRSFTADNVMATFSPGVFGNWFPLTRISHLLDWTLFLFGKPAGEPVVRAANRFENRAFDHFHFGFEGRPSLDFEMTLLSWRNTFRCDIFAEKGSAHIDCLCKWGPSIFTLRKRVLPSGRPTEETERLEMPDPTWVAEYAHFKERCARPAHNLDNDLLEFCRAAEPDREAPADEKYGEPGKGEPGVSRGARGSWS